MFFSVCSHLHAYLHSPWFYMTAGMKICDYLQYKLAQGNHVFFQSKKINLARGVYVLTFALRWVVIFTTSLFLYVGSRREIIRLDRWKGDSYQKAKIILLVFLAMFKRAIALVFSVLLFSSSWMHEKESEHNSEWVKESHGKAWLEKAMASVFPVLLFLSGCVQEKEKQKNKVVVTERKPLKSRNYLAYFPAILNQQTLSTKVIMFLLPHAAEIKDLPIQRSYSQTDLDEKSILFNSELHFWWSYCSCWAKIKNNCREEIVLNC